MIPTLMLGGVPMLGGELPPDDPLWSSVVLLMRFEGANGGTTFVDSGPLGLTIELSGSSFTTSTEQAKAGSSSLKCTGAGGYLRAVNTASTEMNGAWTAECWVYFTQTPAAVAYPFGLERPSGGPGGITGWTDGKIYFNDIGDKINGTNVLSLNAWHHIALTGNGSSYVKMWLDGVQEGSNYGSGVTGYCENGQYTYIGSLTSAAGRLGASTTAAYVDLLRLTKAERYTGTFTPPTSY